MIYCCCPSGRFGKRLLPTHTKRRDMDGQVKITITLVSLFFVFVAVTAVAPGTLQMVNVLYRHGDRSPVASFPTDPYKDKWPQGLGWLTTVGMQQQYALGQFLRSEYGNLLSPSYKNTEIVVASSNVNRCLMSAYCNLAGLYPPQGNQVWNPDLLWQPIPVHTRPEDEDHVLAIEESCPRYNELYDEELQCPIVKEEENTNKDFYDYIEKHTGVKKENITDAWIVADALFCAKTHNYSLPEWADAKWGNMTVYERLKGVQDFGFNLLYNGTELSRLKGGPLLKVFIQNMHKVVQQKQHYKMYMYSAHDSTVAAISDAMKVFNHLPPPYASAVLVELHLVDSDYCVKIRYRNETSAPPFTLMHPDCQKECCPLEEFVAVTKARVPEDWAAECGKKQDIDNKSQWIIAILLGVISLLVLILLVVCCVGVQAHKHRKEYLPLS